jgi:hypothetical protein
MGAALPNIATRANASRQFTRQIRPRHLRFCQRPSAAPVGVSLDNSSIAQGDAFRPSGSDARQERAVRAVPDAGDRHRVAPNYAAFLASPPLSEGLQSGDLIQAVCLPAVSGNWRSVSSLRRPRRSQALTGALGQRPRRSTAELKSVTVASYYARSLLTAADRRARSRICAWTSLGTEDRRARSADEDQTEPPGRRRNRSGAFKRGPGDPSEPSFAPKARFQKFVRSQTSDLGAARFVAEGSARYRLRPDRRFGLERAVF